MESETATLEDAVTARFEAESTQVMLGAATKMINPRADLTSLVRVGSGTDESTHRPYFLQPETGETAWELVTPL